jgi:hypothetical protein
MRIALVALCGLFLTGCNETVKVLDKPVLVERAELILPTTPPAVQLEMKWTVITPENFLQKIKELEGKDVVYYALTAEGYQNLSMNIAELRKYIQNQNAVIAAYKEYYRKRVK